MRKLIFPSATLSANFPAAGGYQTTFGGTDPAFVNANGYVGLHQGDAFVAKISPNGQQLLAATYLGGKLDDVADAITLDSSGNVWGGRRYQFHKFSGRQSLSSKLRRRKSRERVRQCFGGPRDGCERECGSPESLLPSPRLPRAPAGHSRAAATP